MSTFEAKVEVVYDFLANRASLKRLTNAQEVAVVAGYTLKNRQLRRISDPVKRDKITKVLAAVDRKSKAEKGVLLSAVVAHFWDNEVSRHFYERAQKQGVHVGVPSIGRPTWSPATGIVAYRDQVFAAYKGSYKVTQKPAPKPEPARARYGSFEEEKAAAARRAGTSSPFGSGRQTARPTRDRTDVSQGLMDFRSRLAELADDFDTFADEYEGRHRRSEARV